MSEVTQEDLQALDALKRAVAEALERKRRLGQYAVVWRDGRPAIIGTEQAGMNTLTDGQALPGAEPSP